MRLPLLILLLVALVGGQDTRREKARAKFMELAIRARSGDTEAQQELLTRRRLRTDVLTPSAERAAFQDVEFTPLDKEPPARIKAAVPPTLVPQPVFFEGEAEPFEEDVSPQRRQRLRGSHILAPEPTTFRPSLFTQTLAPVPVPSETEEPFGEADLFTELPAFEVAPTDPVTEITVDEPSEPLLEAPLEEQRLEELDIAATQPQRPRSSDNNPQRQRIAPSRQEFSIPSIPAIPSIPSFPPILSSIPSIPDFPPIERKVRPRPSLSRPSVQRMENEQPEEPLQLLNRSPRLQPSNDRQAGPLPAIKRPDQAQPTIRRIPLRPAIQRNQPAIRQPPQPESSDRRTPQPEENNRKLPQPEASDRRQSQAEPSDRRPPQPDTSDRRPPQLQSGGRRPPQIAIRRPPQPEPDNARQQPPPPPSEDKRQPSQPQPGDKPSEPQKDENKPPQTQEGDKKPSQQQSDDKKPPQRPPAIKQPPPPIPGPAGKPPHPRPVGKEPPQPRPIIKRIRRPRPGDKQRQQSTLEGKEGGDPTSKRPEEATTPAKKEPPTIDFNVEEQIQNILKELDKNRATTEESRPVTQQRKRVRQPPKLRPQSKALDSTRQRIQTFKPVQTFTPVRGEATIPQVSAEPTTNPPIPTIDRYSYYEEDGTYVFGYEAADGSFKEERRGKDCVVTGKYGYVDPTGTRREFTYTSGNQCDPNAVDDPAVQDDAVPLNDQFHKQTVERRLTDEELSHVARPTPRRRRPVNRVVRPQPEAEAAPQLRAPVVRTGRRRRPVARPAPRHQPQEQQAFEIPQIPDIPFIAAFTTTAPPIFTPPAPFFTPGPIFVTPAPETVSPIQHVFTTPPTFSRFTTPASFRRAPSLVQSTSTSRGRSRSRSRSRSRTREQQVVTPSPTTTPAVVRTPPPQFFETQQHQQQPPQQHQQHHQQHHHQQQHHQQQHQQQHHNPQAAAFDFESEFSDLFGNFAVTQAPVFAPTQALVRPTSVTKRPRVITPRPPPPPPTTQAPPPPPPSAAQAFDDGSFTLSGSQGAQQLVFDSELGTFRTIHVPTKPLPHAAQPFQPIQISAVHRPAPPAVASHFQAPAHFTSSSAALRPPQPKPQIPSAPQPVSNLFQASAQAAANQFQPQTQPTAKTFRPQTQILSSSQAAARPFQPQPQPQQQSAVISHFQAPEHTSSVQNSVPASSFPTQRQQIQHTPRPPPPPPRPAQPIFPQVSQFSQVSQVPQSQPGIPLPAFNQGFNPLPPVPTGSLVINNQKQSTTPDEFDRFFSDFSVKF